MAKPSGRSNQKPRLGRNTPKLSSCGPKLTAAQLGPVETCLGIVRLPEDYRRFLLKHNGGTPQPSRFTFSDPSLGEMTLQVNRFLEISILGFADDRPIDVLSVALKLRDFLPMCSLPIGFVDRDDILVLFVRGARAGEVWIKIWDEFNVLTNEEAEREATLYFVSHSFSEFLEMLHA